jgi:hypothetical protein
MADLFAHGSSRFLGSTDHLCTRREITLVCFAYLAYRVAILWHGQASPKRSSLFDLLQA